MTEKQERILKAALDLFAKEGYFATSTNKVAKAAGVSEGLIFRHFENKEGLLKAIISEGEVRIRNLYADIVMETNPKEVIRKTIEIPFKVDEADYDFWKLQFKLKWELEHSNHEKMEPLQMALTHAFKKLQYASPELEAELLVHLLDALGGAILKKTLSDKEQMKDHLLRKYQV